MVKMVKIIEYTKERVTFEKENRDDKFFGDNNCSHQNILKHLNLDSNTTISHQFDDGKFIGSLLYVYFKGDS